MPACCAACWWAVPWRTLSMELPFCALAADASGCAAACNTLAKLVCRLTVGLQEPSLTARVGCAELRVKMEALKSSHAA